MIYYPLQGEQGSWADFALGLLGYDRNPARLQAAIRRIFEEATKHITIKGVPVQAVPLFDVLDPTDPTDYIERVEPSADGGKKMATAIMNRICGEK